MEKNNIFQANLSKLPNYQVAELENCQTNKFPQYHAAKLLSCQSAKLANWQTAKLASGQTSKPPKQQAAKLARCQSIKRPSQQVTIPPLYQIFQPGFQVYSCQVLLIGKRVRKKKPTVAETQKKLDQTYFQLLQLQHFYQETWRKDFLTFLLLFQ